MRWSRPRSVPTGPRDASSSPSLRGGLDTGDEDGSLLPERGVLPLPGDGHGGGPHRAGRETKANEDRRRAMNRRGLMGLMAALALAAFTGVSPNALATKAE